MKRRREARTRAPRAAAVLQQPQLATCGCRGANRRRTTAALRCAPRRLRCLSTWRTKAVALAWPQRTLHAGDCSTSRGARLKRQEKARATRTSREPPRSPTAGALERRRLRGGTGVAPKRSCTRLRGRRCDRARRGGAASRHVLGGKPRARRRVPPAGGPLRSPRGAATRRRARAPTHAQCVHLCPCTALQRGAAAACPRQRMTAGAQRCAASCAAGLHTSCGGAQRSRC